MTGKKRGQSAMEFLMTYGWAILVIIIVVAVLFYMGIMNQQNTQPDSCVLAPGFSCYTFKVAGPNATLYLDLGQATGGGVVVTGIGCSESPLPDVMLLTNPVYVAAGDSSEVAAGGSGNSIQCTDADGNNITAVAGVSDKFSGTIAINYTTLSDNSTHVVYGDIHATIGTEILPITGTGCSPNCNGDSVCTASSQCASGYCTGGLCTNCSSNDQCASGFCNLLTGRCASFPPCPPHCGDGVCTGDETGCSCSDDCGPGSCMSVEPVCGDGDCDTGESPGESHETCPADCPLDCSGYADGFDCISNEECSSGYCPAGVCETCVSDCPIGAACALNSTCASGLCEGGRCTTCTGNRDCPTGYCSNGTCEASPGGSCPSSITYCCEIDTDGTYSLADDIGTTGSGCMTIGASGSNAALNCVGRAIYMVPEAIVPNWLLTKGVGLVDGVTGATVSNCHVEDFSSGIALNEADESVISGNTVSCSGRVCGIQVAYANGNAITGNTVTSAHGGIYLISSSNNTLSGNILSSGTGNAIGVGAGVYPSLNNTLTGNHACGDGTEDITCTVAQNDGGGNWCEPVGINSTCASSVSCATGCVS